MPYLVVELMFPLKLSILNRVNHDRFSGSLVLLWRNKT